MGTAVAQLMPVALGFALSPIPLVEMVLVLFSRRALTNGLVFLGCIMLPVFVIPFLEAAGQDAAAATALERSTTQGVILIVVAAVLPSKEPVPCDPLLAAGAPQNSLEVVVMRACPDACARVRGKHLR
jgi:hypothetical protein